MTDLVKKISGVAVVVLLGVGVWVLYSSMQPTVSRLQDTDPLAREALMLVQKHLSREGYTLEESLQLFVDQMQERGVTFNELKWQVASQGADKYVVRKVIREKGSVEWIEREFAWRVNVKENSIRVISLAAQQLMPFENLPPLPHGEEISGLFRSLSEISDRHEVVLV